MKRLTLAFCVLIAAGCSQQSPASPSEPAAAAAGATEARTDTSLGHGGRPIGTRLSGAAEVPGPGDPDGDGFARLTLNRGKQELCFWLSALQIEPATAAHIHKAPAGSAGPVVVGLTPPTDGLSTRLPVGQPCAHRRHHQEPGCVLRQRPQRARIRPARSADS